MTPRIIKFRKWVEDSDYPAGGYYVSGDDLAIEEYDLLTDILSHPNYEQFIGVTDFNNQDIYAGDVIDVVDLAVRETFGKSCLWRYFQRQYEVVWQGVSWKIKQLTEQPYPIAEHFWDFPTEHCEIRVLGNVREGWQPLPVEEEITLEVNL